MTELSNLLIILIASILISVIIVIKLWGKLSKKRKKQIHFIASFITIISIIFAVFFFYFEQNRLEKIELENKKVLLYTLKDEIDFDIKYSEAITGLRQKLLETYEVPSNRFLIITIEEAINKGDIGDIQFKTDLRKVYWQMGNVNRILDEIPMFMPEIPEQSEGFLKLKRERMIVLIENNDNVKPLLYSLKSRTESLIKSLEK